MATTARVRTVLKRVDHATDATTKADTGRRATNGTRSFLNGHQRTHGAASKPQGARTSRTCSKSRRHRRATHHASRRAGALQRHGHRAIEHRPRQARCHVASHTIEQRCAPHTQIVTKTGAFRMRRVRSRNGVFQGLGEAVTKANDQINGEQFDANGNRVAKIFL